MLEICKTSKLIPPQEIERVFRDSLSASAEMDCSFLCFEEVYEKVSKHCGSDTIIIDLGCAYMPQAYWFTDCKKYIGIDLPFMNDIRFKTDNSEVYLMTGQQFIAEVLPTLNLDMENVVAVCSYVPDKELQQLVAKTFKYNYVVYCEDVISDKLPRKTKQ